MTTACTAIIAEQDCGPLLTGGGLFILPAVRGPESALNRLLHSCASPVPVVCCYCNGQATGRTGKHKPEGDLRWLRESDVARAAASSPATTPEDGCGSAPSVALEEAAALFDPLRPEGLQGC